MTDPLQAMRRGPGIMRLHGHRGARGIWPENTLLGFAATFDIGIEAIELDVLLTQDGIPVVTHNPRLLPASTRCPDGQWLSEDDAPLVRDLKLADLAAYDIGGLRAGTDYAALYPDQAFLTDQHVPTLAQVAELVQHPEHRHVWLNIEIKSNPEAPDLTYPPRQLAAAFARAIVGAGLSDRVIVQSFDWRVLRHLSELAPDLPRSHLTYRAGGNPKMMTNIRPDSPWMDGASLAEHGGSLPRLIAALGGQVWSPFYRDVVAGEVAEAQALGLVVNAWTVNAPDDLERMIDAGVDGIITDYPGRAQRHLVARGLRWR